MGIQEEYDSMSMKRLIGLMVGLTLFMGVVGCSGSGDVAPNTDGKKETINLGVTPYPQIEVITSILETAFEELGYGTERVEGDIGFMYLGMSQGDIDVYPDGWLPILHGNYIDKYGDKLEVGNTLYEQVTMGIVVPDYVEIDTIQELKENADMFDNKLIGIEPSAGIMLTATETLEAYDMGDDIEILEGSTPAMLAEVDNAIRAKEPVAFLGWRPHIMFSEYDLKVLEDDKGIWEYDDVLSVMNPEFKNKAPQAYEFLEEFQITVDDIEDILLRVDLKEGTIHELSVKWFADNREALDDVLEQGDDK